jgi:hypothetical protein
MTMTQPEEKKKRKMGRPKIPLVFIADDSLPAKEINFEQIRYWCDIGATQEEIAGAFYVSADTLSRRIKEKFNMTFAEFKEKTSGAAKIKLRQNQFSLSQKNASMAIWLGKIWLGQQDPDKVIAQQIGEKMLEGILDWSRDPTSQEPQPPKEIEQYLESESSSD